MFHRLRALDQGIVWGTIGFTVFGLIMLLSATAVISVERAHTPWYYVQHQLISGVLPGMIAFFVLAFIDYRVWKRWAGAAFFVTIILLLLVYFPGIGREIGGSKSWVTFGPIGFQPSEFVKLSFLIYVSGWLANREGSQAYTPETGLVPFAGALGLVVLLLVLQPDTGSMAVIVGTALTLYFLSGAPIGWFAGLFVAGTGIIAFLIKTSSYRAARFMTFLHPELDPQGIGYHINQAILAIGSGGWLGLGYGHSRQKFLYLPEVESDSIVAIMAEELGFVLMVIFLCALALLVYRCFAIARESRDRFGAYLASGVGAWLAIQAIINIGSMTGVMPMTGVTLPFVSHGGSAMTVLLGAMGLVAGIGGATDRHTSLRV